jgi:hypothetical protein
LGSRQAIVCVCGGSLVSVLAVVLGSNIFPAVRFLHVLFTVGFTLGSVRAGLEVAFIERGCRGVLVVVVTIHLFLGGPAILVIFACLNWALPWAGVRLFVLGQVTRAFEFFVTSRFTASLWG